MATAEKPTFTDPEPIETGRLRLRMFRPAGVDQLAPFYAGPEVMK